MDPEEVDPPWRHDRIAAGGVGLHTVEMGEGPLVLLLHGFPEFHYSWRHQIPALARRFRTVAPDLPGYGLSSESISGYDIPTLAGQLARAIESLGCQRAHVVGHDWGAVLAWALATLHPDRVDHLAILNGPHPAGFIRGMNPRQIRRSWYILFFQLPWLPERLLDPAVALAAGCGKGFRFGEGELDRYRKAFPDPASLRAPLAYYRTAFRRIARDFAPLSRPIDHPTLVLWGEEDPALGRHLLDGFGRYASDLRIETFPGAGHWIQQERPAEVNRALLDFLPP